VNTFGDGVWLAFATGTTLGYGDFVPTTTAARLWAAVMVLLGFAMLLSIAVGLISGLYPAWHCTKINPSEALRQ
jgi:voltage-gated potassium channel